MLKLCSSQAKAVEKARAFIGEDLFDYLLDPPVQYGDRDKSQDNAFGAWVDVRDIIAPWFIKKRSATVWFIMWIPETAVTAEADSRPTLRGKL